MNVFNFILLYFQIRNGEKENEKSIHFFALYAHVIS
jgi:hypothetical protein